MNWPLEIHWLSRITERTNTRTGVVGRGFRCQMAGNNVKHVCYSAEFDVTAQDVVVSTTSREFLHVAIVGCCFFLFFFFRFFCFFCFFGVMYELCPKNFFLAASCILYWCLFRVCGHFTSRVCWVLLGCDWDMCCSWGSIWLAHLGVLLRVSMNSCMDELRICCCWPLWPCERVICVFRIWTKVHRYSSQMSYKKE